MIGEGDDMGIDLDIGWQHRDLFEEERFQFRAILQHDHQPTGTADTVQVEDKAYRTRIPGQRIGHMMRPDESISSDPNNTNRIVHFNDSLRGDRSLAVSMTATVPDPLSPAP